MEKLANKPSANRQAMVHTVRVQPDKLFGIFQEQWCGLEKGTFENFPKVSTDIAEKVKGVTW